jgi:hypothetical protein
MQQPLLPHAARCSCLNRPKGVARSHFSISASAVPPQRTGTVTSGLRHKAITNFVAAAASVLLSYAGSGALAAEVNLTADPVVSWHACDLATGHDSCSHPFLITASTALPVAGHSTQAATFSHSVPHFKLH